MSVQVPLVTKKALVAGAACAALGLALGAATSPIWGLAAGLTAWGYASHYLSSRQTIAALHQQAWDKYELEAVARRVHESGATSDQVYRALQRMGERPALPMEQVARLLEAIEAQQAEDEASSLLPAKGTEHRAPLTEAAAGTHLSHLPNSAVEALPVACGSTGKTGAKREVVRCSSSHGGGHA